MKYIVIIPDGMADNPLEELGNKTPLEVAHTINMDYMAQNGTVGLVKTIPDRMKPGSDVGNLALIGYNPEKCFAGRASLEAANLGVELDDDEIAFRCNFVTVVNDRMEDYSAGHISTGEAESLIHALNEHINEKNIRFIAGKGYRHLLVMKVRNIKDFTKIKCVPPHDILGRDIQAYLPHDMRTGTLLRLMEQSKSILGEHPVNNVRIDLKENPANMIWLWGQGTRPRLPSFKEKFGVDGAIISAVDLVNGIGRLAGLEVIDVPGITGYYDTNYSGKAEYALDCLTRKDVVFIHIEGPDEAGHNGDLEAKIFCIERIDKEIVGAVLNHFNKNDDVRVLVLPDHPTPVALRTHARTPVCFVMYGRGVVKDEAVNYSEVSAKEMGLKFRSGEALMEHFMKHS